MAYIKAFLSLIEILLVVAGIIPVNTNIDYGGKLTWKIKKTSRRKK